MWYGWAFFISVGVGSYVFAKRSVSKDRAQRQAFENERRMHLNRQLAMAEMERDRKAAAASLEAGAGTPKKGEGGTTRGSGTTQGAPGTGQQHVWEKSKFEASEPYRSPKGDRLG